MKKHTLKYLLCILTLFTFSCSTLEQSKINSLREPSSDKEMLEMLTESEKLKIYIAIQKEIPDLYLEALRKNIVLFNILDRNDELEILLSTHSKFSEFWKPEHLKTILNTKLDMYSIFEFKMGLKKLKAYDFSEDISSLYTQEDSKLLKNFFELLTGKTSYSTQEINAQADQFITHFKLNSLEAKSIHEKYLFNAYLVATDAQEAKYLSQNIKRLLEDFRFENESVVVRNETVYPKWESQLNKQSAMKNLRLPYLAALKDSEVKIESISNDLPRYLQALSQELPQDYVIPPRRLYTLVTLTHNKNLARKAVQSKDPDVLLDLVEFVFSRPYAAEWKDIVSQAIKNAVEMKNENVIRNFARYTLSKPHTKEWKDIMTQTIQAAIQLKSVATLDDISEDVFSQPHAAEWKDLSKYISEFLTTNDWDKLKHKMGVNITEQGNNLNCAEAVQLFL